MTDKQDDLIEAGAFTVGGMATSGMLSGVAGKIALVVGGTTMSVGLLPVVAVGATTGLALYGGKRVWQSSGIKDKYAEALEMFMPPKDESTEESKTADSKETTKA